MASALILLACLSGAVLVRQERLLSALRQFQLYQGITTTLATKNPSSSIEPKRVPIDPMEFTERLSHPMAPEDPSVASTGSSSTSSTFSTSTSPLWMKDFRVCRTERIYFPLTHNGNSSSSSSNSGTTTTLSNSTSSFNSTNAAMAASSISSLPVHYQCRGQAYDQFTSKLEHYVQQRYLQSGNASLWGRRHTSPLPSNTTILVLGNSHTRQTMYALLCQYADHIAAVRSTLVYNHPSAPLHDIVFDNGATLVFATNSPLVYSSQWYEALQHHDPYHRSLTNNNRSSSDYDAVVLGEFNLYHPDKPSKFLTQMLEFELLHPEEVQFTTATPPTLKSLAQLLPNTPIVALPMFAEYGHKWEQQSRKEFLQLSKSRRNTIHVLHGRQHIVALQHECGSDGIIEVGTCWDRGQTTPYGRKPPDMHRCTGPRGGHADLLAWDLIEAIHKVLESRNNHPPPAEAAKGVVKKKTKKKAKKKKKE